MGRKQLAGAHPHLGRSNNRPAIYTNGGAKMVRGAIGLLVVVAVVLVLLKVAVFGGVLGAVALILLVLLLLGRI
jgi:hypothetical protein